jgi:hypothetical protein
LLKKKNKHAGPKRGGVTQGFVKGLLRPIRAAQWGSEKPKEVTKKKKEKFPRENPKGL